MKTLLLFLNLILLTSTSSLASTHVYNFDGQPLFTRILKGDPNSPWVIMIHGLSDESSLVFPLADELNRHQFNILMMDLPGHGRTLIEEVQNKSDLYNYSIYQTAKIIASLSIHLKIKSPIIIGHSYGGTVAYLTAHLLESGGYPVRSVHMMAPYVERLDHFLSQSMKDGTGVLLAQKQWLKMMGFPAVQIEKRYAGIEILNSATQAWLDFSRDLARRSMSVDKTKDFYSDPMMKNSLLKAYSEYISIHAQEADFLNDQNRSAFVTLQAEAAYHVMLGAREFSLCDRSQKILPVSAPIQIIGGASDQLVHLSQLNQAYQRLLTQGFNVRIDQTDGNHLFPRQNVQTTMKTLFSALEHLGFK